MKKAISTGASLVSVLLAMVCALTSLAAIGEINNGGVDDSPDLEAVSDCEIRYNLICPTVFEPAMCIYPGPGKWFAASTRCRAVADLKLWACEQGEDVENLNITCYRAVLEE